MRKRKFTFLLAGLLALSLYTANADSVSDRFTITVRGTGPDVILVPGLGCSPAVWEATAAHLEAHYRLHLVQLAGFGGLPAQANAKGPIIQPVVDALDAYVKTNQLKTPYFIGHSLGGLTGLMLVQQHPEDVGKLMIVDSLPFFGVLFGAKDAAAAEPQAAMMRDMVLNETQEAYIQGESQFLPGFVKSPAGLKAVNAWAIASDKSVVARATYEDMTTDLRAKLAGIKTPVTMLYPYDATAGLPLATVDRVYQKSYATLPNKKLVRIDDSRHFIMLDQPTAFAAQVDAFLK